MSKQFKKLRVIELCSGLGGTKLGCEQTGVFEVVQASEIDHKVIQTYFDNFGEMPLGDFSKIKPHQWKDCDVIAASLPCQSYSTQGNHKGLDDDRGALFYNYMNIVNARKPSALFIENVPGMARLNDGEYLDEILKTLTSAGYYPHHKILKASDFGVPQARERLFICAFSKNIKFEFPKPQIHIPMNKDILEKSIDNKYFLTQAQIDVLIDKKKEYEKKGHGFGYKVIDENGLCRTLCKSQSSRIKNLLLVKATQNKKYGTIELPTRNGKKARYHLRHLTPRECARLQGFPDWYKFTSNEASTYEQLGNAVAVPVIREIFKEIFVSLMAELPPTQEDPTDSNELRSSPIEADLIEQYDKKIKAADQKMKLRLIDELRVKIAIVRAAQQKQST